MASLHRPFMLVCLAYLSLAVVSGCATLLGQDEGGPSSSGLTPAQTVGSSPGLSRDENTPTSLGFADVPIPTKFKFDRSKSFIYEAGSGTVKVGRLFFSGWAKLDDVIAFYQNEMINNDWTMLRVVGQAGSTLEYEKEGVMCTVTITSSLGKSNLQIVIGPK